MARILKVNVNTTTIGLDDGNILEVDTASLDFIPQVDDRVEVYRNNYETIIKRKEAQPTYHSYHSTGYQQVFINGTMVNKIVYGVLALLFGSFGVHKFYAGKIGKGIMYFIFSWTIIPTILSIIEGISVLTRPADENGNIIV